MGREYEGGLATADGWGGSFRAPHAGGVVPHPDAAKWRRRTSPRGEVSETVALPRTPSLPLMGRAARPKAEPGGVIGLTPQVADARLEALEAGHDDVVAELRLSRGVGQRVHDVGDHRINCCAGWSSPMSGLIASPMRSRGCR